MLAAYGRAGDPLDPAVSTRRFSVLLEGLPPHARRAGEQWSTESELLALVCDHLANLSYILLKANGAKSAKKPQPLPRPGDGKRERRGRNGQQQRQQPAPDGRQRQQMSGWAAAADQLAGIPGVNLHVEDAAGGLLVSDRERDNAIDAIKAGFTSGRLPIEDARPRIEQALKARNRGDLNKATAGLPGFAVLGGGAGG